MFRGPEERESERARERERERERERREALEGTLEEEMEEDRPTTSSTTPGPSTTSTGERNTRQDPVPREEHLTDEDRAIMAAVENRVVSSP